jgi:catechol 2,3-dioxygenase-like lactoylglutathione lyase family enzyme
MKLLCASLLLIPLLLAAADESKKGTSVLATKKIIAFVTTADPKAAKAFYQGTLGLKLLGEDNFAFVFDANGIMLRVAIAKEVKPAPYTVLGWQVTDIADTLNQLVKAGVKFESFGLPGQEKNGIWNAPGGDKVAWFKDPSGNILSISQHVDR